MPEKESQFNKDSRASNRFLSWSGLFPFITMETVVLFITGIGYIRFFGFNFVIQDIASLQINLITDNFEFIIFPVIWGIFVWLLFNYINNQMSMDRTLEIWNVLSRLVFTNNFNSPVRWFEFGLGCILPYLFFSRDLFGDFIIFHPIFPYLCLLTIVSFIYCFVLLNLKIHNKPLATVSQLDIRYKVFFYKIIVPIIIPFCAIIGLIFIPEAIGKIWGLNKLYDALYFVPHQVQIINVSPQICWPKKESGENVKYFTELKDKVIYIKYFPANLPKRYFLEFLFKYALGEKPYYSLCMVSIAQMKFDHELPYQLDVINP